MPATVALLLTAFASGCTSSEPATSARAAASTTPTANSTPTVPATWSLAATSLGNLEATASLESVSCSGDSDCWAVGWAQVPQARPLTTQGPGAGWSSVLGGAQPEGASGRLFGVSCVSASDCWAVGYAGLIEHYDGSGWSAVPGPSLPGGAWAFLFGVTCFRPGECWAVGESVGAGSNNTAPLVEEYAAGEWSLVSTPPPDDSESYLAGVACVSAGDCWAVGKLNGDGGDPKTLIEQYADGLWSVVPSPSPPGGGGQLNDVSCTSENHCWAVGSTARTATSSAPLIEQYGGTSWSVAASPAPVSEESQLMGVACAGAARCWAVGYSGAHPLIEGDTGSGWRVVASPSPPGNAETELNGVACASTGECFAAGGVTEMVTDEGAPAFVEET